MRIGGGDQRNESTLVALVVEQNCFAVTWLSKLATFVAVGHRNLQGKLGSIDGSAVQGNTSLHQCSQHGEESSTWAGDR